MITSVAEDEEELGPPGAPLLGSMPHQQVQRPRLLVCGQEGAGQSHLGPALLYALEGLPVHALGLPSLLSDASARSVLIFNPCQLTILQEIAKSLKQHAGASEFFTVCHLRQFIDVQLMLLVVALEQLCYTFALSHRSHASKGCIRVQRLLLRCLTTFVSMYSITVTTGE